jgi:hypothetical protein
VKLQVTGFSSSGTPASPAPNDPSARYFSANFVEPSTGDYNTQTNPSAPTLPRNQGFYIIAPDAQRDFVLDNNAVNDMTPTLRKTHSGQTPQAPQGPATNNDPVWGQAFGGTAMNQMSYDATQEGAGAMPPPTAFAARKGNYEGGRRHTILLRRLACPGLDPNPLIPGTSTPYFANKPFNPYITVDYMRQVPTNDAVQYVGSGQGGITKDNQNYMPANQRRSLARRQPYAASLTRLTEASGQARPVHATFYKHNETTAAVTSTPNIDVPFDWLIHLDRAPATVTELLNVSAVAPHQLTQRFITGQYDSNDVVARQLQAEAKYQHLAPWRDQNARLFRALEFFTVGDRSPYPGTGGRVAGKMNINTMLDRYPADAAADLREKMKLPAVPKPANFSFENPATATLPNVPNTGASTDAWQGNPADPLNNSMVRRKQGLLGGTGPASDRPYWPFAAPIESSYTGAPGNTGDQQYPATPYYYPYPAAPTGTASIGLADTILGGTFTPQHNPATQVSVDYNPSPDAQVKYTCFQAPDQANLQDPQQKFPPYILNELLTKVTGHLTTRSNNFAVFLTVGFFEVTDDTSRPVKLGPEIVQSNGKTVRHQMFSVVDRTNLAIDAGKALDPIAPNVSGRLQQAATPPVFMSLADAIHAGQGAPTSNNPKATPLVINIAGGLPTSYDALAPVTFKPFQLPPNAATPALPPFWRSGDRMFIGGTPPAGTPAPTYWTSGYQWMFLDSGATQEPVQVTLDQTGTRLQLLFPNGAQFSHPPGATLCTYQPGNPGPQGAIDFTSPQFKAVVPFTYVVQ